MNIAAERRVLQLLHGGDTRAFVREIHAHLLRWHLHDSTLVLAHLISVAGSLRRTAYALRLCLHCRHPNLLLFNSTIKAHSLNPCFSAHSLRLFSLMRQHDIIPDRFTFAPLLKSCANRRDFRFGRAIHADTLVAGFDSHLQIAIAIVDLYVTCDQMEHAHKVFDGMPFKDAVVWNMMINGFCKRGHCRIAYRLFREMEERNVVTWNSMILGLARTAKDAEAMELFQEMRASGLELDDVTLVTVLPVCARMGAWDVGRWIHEYADRRGLLSKNAFVHVGNSLVDMYCKCGDLASARMVFDKMPEKSLVSWNALINGLAFNGRGDAGMELFEEMKRRGFEPNAGTFLGVLGCCTHAGLVERGRELFRLMSAEHGVVPGLEHYGCMVDLLGRYGFVKEGYEFIKSMSMRPSAAIWGALLSACRNHGDVGTAEMVIKELIGLEPQNSGNYVLLSNLYAESGRWDDVEGVRLLMKENIVRKEPGQSAVESSDVFGLVANIRAISFQGSHG